jgi:hypothetical protein
MTGHNYFILITRWIRFDPETMALIHYLNLCANQLFQKSELVEYARQRVLTLRSELKYFFDFVMILYY